MNHHPIYQRAKAMELQWRQARLAHDTSVPKWEMYRDTGARSLKLETQARNEPAQTLPLFEQMEGTP